MLTSALRLLVAGVFMIASSAARAEDDAIVVFAAISLKVSLDKIGPVYSAQKGTRIVFSYGASGALAKQIENGAPADIFASADRKWMDYLADKKLVDADARLDLLGNELVLIAPADSGAALAIAPGFKLADALGDGRLAMGNPASVPAGTYAEAALRTLGVWDQVSSKLAMTENVRGALAFVARGEAPLGIVYKTDALTEPKVRVIGTFPSGSHPPIVYPFARVAASKKARAVAEFLLYLQLWSASGIFEADGFKAPLKQRKLDF